MPYISVLFHQIALWGATSSSASSFLHQLFFFRRRNKFSCFLNGKIWLNCKRNCFFFRFCVLSVGVFVRINMSIFTIESWKSFTSASRNRPAKWAAILAVYVARKITLKAPHTLISTCTRENFFLVFWNIPRKKIYSNVQQNNWKECSLTLFGHDLGALKATRWLNSNEHITHKADARLKFFVRWRPQGFNPNGENHS